MRIDFLKEDIPEQLVEFHYKSVMDMHMSYEKRRFDRDLSYIKYSGVFVLATLGLMIIDSLGAASNYILGIMVFGIGILFALTMNMTFISSGIDSKCTRYLEEGISIEEKYHSLVDFRYFQANKAARAAQYRASLFKRLFPFVFVGGLTIWAGTSLSLMVSTGLGLMIGIGGTALLILATFLLAGVIRRCQFLIGKKGS